MATFENPNDPVQPQAGVYGWYATKADKSVTLYIGEAGKKVTPLPKGTLFRGVSELQRNTFSSNSPDYNVLDTDFIVGTALKYFEKCGYKCTWRHISNDPNQEIDYVRREHPALQSLKNLDIDEKFKIKRSTTGYWSLKASSDKKMKVNEAENEIFKQLALVANKE